MNIGKFRAFQQCECLQLTNNYNYVCWKNFFFLFEYSKYFSREITNDKLVFLNFKQSLFAIKWMCFYYTSAKLIWTNINARSHTEKKNAEKLLDEDIFNNKLIRFLVKMLKNVLQQKFNRFPMEISRLFQSIEGSAPFWSNVNFSIGCMVYGQKCDADHLISLLLELTVQKTDKIARRE